MLATFLLSKGQSVQQIAPLFKNAPDYNERVTLYQLKSFSRNFWKWNSIFLSFM